MKSNYLHVLKKYLERKNVDRHQINEIVIEYSILYDEVKEAGFSDEEIIIKLGNPKEIYDSLKDDLYKDISFVRRGKVTGLMVFVSLILFFVVGNAFDLWAYSWLFFFLIPLSGIVMGKRRWKNLPGIMVFLSLAAFFLLGMIGDLWHPGWLVFLSIPLSAILSNGPKGYKLVASMPFITLIIYFIVSSIYQDFYLYGLPLFLLIPLTGTIHMEDKLKRNLMFGSLLLSIILYYTFGLIFDNWIWPLLAFVMPLTYAIYTKNLKVQIGIINNPFLALLSILVLVGYFVVSLLTTGWAWTWMFLLLIPMIAIYGENKFSNIVEYTPFISVVLFYSVGYFIDGGWTYSWLFFLMIPMTGIIFDTKVKRVKKKPKEIDDI